MRPSRKIRGNNPTPTLNHNIFLQISLTSTLISFKILNRVSFHKTIKIRGNNPILAPKSNIFLDISLTSTPISVKTSQQGFISRDVQNKG